MPSLDDLKFFLSSVITSVKDFSESSSSFPELFIDSKISGFSDLHFSMILI